MQRNDWLVGAHGIRPAGRPDQCFYCNAAKGDQHRMGCIIRQRTIVIRTIVEHTVTVPEGFTKENIEFVEGSSCSNNHVRDLMKLLDRLGDEKCICGMLSIEFVREADSEDETESNCFVAASES